MERESCQIEKEINRVGFNAVGIFVLTLSCLRFPLQQLETINAPKTANSH